MAQIRDIVVDCAHPASLARFWASILDGYSVAPYNDAELARLAANGITSPEDDPTVLVESSDSAAPRFFFQLVPEPKRTKNRVHLDLAIDQTAGNTAVQELQRFIERGATVLDDTSNPSLIVLADPEGNEFCLLR